MVIHNNAHLACQCNLLYAESRSCLNINILLFGFLYRMNCKLCKTRRIHLPYCSGANLDSSILLFIESVEGPSHEQSCVSRSFLIVSAFSLIVNWLATPIGITHAFFNSGRILIGIGIIHPLDTSFPYCLFTNSITSFDFDDDLWFPLFVFSKQSFFNVSSSICDKVVSVPLDKNVLNLSQLL